MVYVLQTSFFLNSIFYFRKKRDRARRGTAHHELLEESSSDSGEGEEVEEEGMGEIMIHQVQTFIIPPLTFSKRLFRFVRKGIESLPQTLIF